MKDKDRGYPELRPKKYDKSQFRNIGSRTVGYVQGGVWFLSVETITSRPVVAGMVGVAAGIGEYRRAKKAGY